MSKNTEDTENKKNTEMVTVTRKEYESLLENSEILSSLECAGVDNWEGYDLAMEEFHSNHK